MAPTIPSRRFDRFQFHFSLWVCCYVSTTMVCANAPEIPVHEESNLSTPSEPFHQLDIYYYHANTMHFSTFSQPFIISLLFGSSVNSFISKPKMKLIPRQFSIPLDLYENDSVGTLLPSNHPYCVKTAEEAAYAFVQRLRDSSRPKMIV